MAAYVIADVEVLDDEDYAEYRRRVPATIEQFGGKFVVRGGDHEVKEGDWRPTRLVLIEFPSIEQARAWYPSSEYAELIPLRHRDTKTHSLVIVDGS
jgi:uncharacterized protein (DUF1330 family)